MTAKVSVDKDYRRVADGSPEAAFILNADDPRLKSSAKKEPAPSQAEPAGSKK